MADGDIIALEAPVYEVVGSLVIGSTTDLATWSA